MKNREKFLFIAAFIAALAAIIQIVIDGGVYKKLSDEHVKSEISYLSSHRFYVKDPNTNQCFLYVNLPGNQGGPAIATIPCESIPPDKLHILER